MLQPLDPTAAAFLMAENPRMPMHVGALQLFAKPEDPGRDFVRDLYAQLRESDDVAPLFRKHPVRLVRTGGQYVWQEDGGVVILEVTSIWRLHDDTVVEIKACSIFTLADGKFVDQRIYVDNARSTRRSAD